LGAGAKGAAVVKSALLASCLAPFLGLFAGVASQWMVVRAHTPQEQRRGKFLKFILTWVFLVGIPVLGDTGTRSLGQHWHWSEQTEFIAVADFWFVWCLVLASWLIMGFRQELALRLNQETLSGPEKSLSRAQSFVLAVGTYLMMFSWLLSMMWRTHDRIAAAAVASLMLVLTVWHIVQLEGKAGVAATKATYSYLALCCAMVVAVINLRVDVWMAAERGVSVDAIHQLLPFWIVPLLTFGLAIWVAALSLRTRGRATGLKRA
jgi:hypothetical protein